MFKALKDRRSRLARSRSSHDVVAHNQQQGELAPLNCGPSGVEVEDTRTSAHIDVNKFSKTRSIS